MQQHTSDGGQQLHSFSGCISVKKYNNILPIQLPGASISHDLNICCAIEFRVQPIKEEGGIVKSFKKFFN